MDKVTCPICLGLLYRPIALPCSHEFCRECILNAVDYTAFQCPICRFRLSNWLRKVKDIDSAVDEDKENRLRDLFPDYYREKELGKSPILSATEQRCLRNLVNDGPFHRDGIPASQGDLYSDYIKQMEKEARIRAMEEQRNEEASLALAVQLLAEDGITADVLIPTTEVTETADNDLNSTPSQFSETVCSGQVSTKDTRTEQPKVTRRRTLLDYAVYKGPKPSEASHDQVSRDANFARKLQSEYQKVASPVITRSRTRSHTLRTLRTRNK